jgi:protein-disulfide isomerase
MRQFTVMIVSFFLWCAMGISSGTAEQTPAGLSSSLEERVDGRPMDSTHVPDGDLGNESNTVPPPAFPGNVSQNDVIAAVQKVLQDRPDLILAALEKYPVGLAALVEKSAQLRQVRMEEEQWRLEMTSPKVPEINGNRPMRGSPQAPVTIVEYSDFECPYCRSVFPTLMEVSRQYEGMVRLVYKHNPLSFHPTAEPAARYFEAIALQDHDQAWGFHDRVFEQQEHLSRGVETLKEIVAALDIDHERLEADLHSDTVEQRLTADRAEAERFGFDGTPAFVINGVSLVGNHPITDFERIIEFVVSAAPGKTD